MTRCRRPASVLTRSRTRLLLVVVLTGVGAGAAGIALTLLLHLVQHLAYGYTEDSFLTGVQRASPVRRIVVMAMGGALVGLGWWLLRGRLEPLLPVPEVLAMPGQPARVRVSIIDAVLQIVAVGVGASLGREGAPRQVGAALGRRLAQRARLTPDHERTALACGAGAGLAAVYNVPLSGALFTLEILLRSGRVRHVIPAALCSAIATVVALAVLPDRPTYDIPALHPSMRAIVFAIAVGPLAAGVGALFVRLMAAAEGRQPSGWRLPVATTLMFAAVGALAAGFPEMLGNGKGLTQLTLTATPPLLLLAALLLLKPLATAACLSSGATGGLLTPALATGAALGAITGRLWGLVWPGTPLAVYVLVAATAVLATTQRAPLTAIALGLELTHVSPTLLIALVLATACARLTASRLPRFPAPPGEQRAEETPTQRQRPG